MDFDLIYKEFSPKIFRLCLGYLNDFEKAKDLTQDTFIAVWQNMDSFKQESGLGTWIYRIAANKCLRQIEKDTKTIRTKLPVIMETDSFPENAVEEKHAFLRKCIAELPELERLIMGLLLEDLPQEKIAEVTGISHSNIRVKIHRIKEKLVQKFKSHGNF